ncbi:hypothetical protein [Cellulomonas sp. URHB0016]
MIPPSATFSLFSAPRRRTRALAVGALLFTLTACAHEPGSPAPTGTSSDRPQADSGPTDAPEPSLAVPIPGGTPFSPYFAQVNALLAQPEETSATAKERHDDVEAYIASCMKDAGFDYFPTEYEKSEQLAWPWARDVLQLPLLATDRAEVERVGYGVDDVDAQEADRHELETPDKNGVYNGTLGEAAQSEYDYALSGTRGEDDPDPDPAGGCFGRASAKYPEPTSPQADLAEQYMPLVRTMGDIRIRDLARDPRVVDLNEQWNACMLDAGYDLTPPEGVRQQTPDPVSAYFLAVRTPPDGVAEYPADGAEAGQIPVERRYLVGSPAERAIALADFDCRAATSYQSSLLSVLVDLEGAFVAAHQRELDEMGAALDIG